MDVLSGNGADTGLIEFLPFRFVSVSRFHPFQGIFGIGDITGKTIELVAECTVFFPRSRNFYSTVNEWEKKLGSTL